MRNNWVLPGMHKLSEARRFAFLLYQSYEDRKYTGAGMTEQKRREQIAFPNQKQNYRDRRTVQKIPTREQREADPSYSGHSAGIHPENQPFMSQELTHSNRGRNMAATRTPETFDIEGEYELEEDESYYDTRLPTSTRRYQVSPEEVYQSGNTRYHVRYVDVPQRKSRQAQLPPGRERHTDAYEAVTQRGRQRRQFHPLVWLGVFGVFLVLGWFGLNAFTSWYQGVQDDLTYGKQRHFEVNAVVGHNDSLQHPSHFTAENNNGQIIVIELPGGDVSKAKIYQIETVPGNAGNPPVKLMFKDMNGDNKPDMIVQIGDGSAMIYLTLFNNGIEFVSKP
jgi:hypothetical protein